MTLPPVSFAYEAVGRDGARITGSVLAADRESALLAIGRQGAFPISLREQPGEAPSIVMRADDLALGFRALASLLEGGVPIARALTVLEDLAPAAWRKAIPVVRSRVEQGESLAAALGASGLLLPPFVLGLVEAGEAGSGLGSAMRGAAQLLEARASHRASVRNALAYPAILAVAGSGSVALLLGVVLPRFAELFAETGQTVPLAARAALFTFAVIRTVWMPLTALAVGAILYARVRLRAGDGRARWHRWLRVLPVVGEIRRAASAGHSCSVLASLLDAGVPLATALPHAARAGGDLAAERLLLAARERLAAGEGIAAAMAAEDALSPAAVQLTRIGEETGALSRMLEHAGRLESTRALDALQRAIRVIEPLLLLLFGGLVMLVAGTLMQAMYGLRLTP